jgi:hypothetical protein
MEYADLTPHQLLSIVRGMGWQAVPCRAVHVHLEPVAENARPTLPAGLCLAVHERRAAVRVLLALESHQSRRRSFADTLQMGD